MVQDQKRDLGTRIKRSNTKHQYKVGLAFLGGDNARQAYDFYKVMGDKYWAMRAQNKKVLSIVARCYAIAAENAGQIVQAYSKTNLDIKGEMQINFTENLKMAEAIAQKIKEDPTCDAVKEYMKTFDQAE